MHIHVQLAAQVLLSMCNHTYSINFDESTVASPVYHFTDDSRVDGYPFEQQDFDLLLLNLVKKTALRAGA